MRKRHSPSCWTIFGDSAPIPMRAKMLKEADTLLNSVPGMCDALNQNQWDAIASLVASVLSKEASHHYYGYALGGNELFTQLLQGKHHLALSCLAEYVYDRTQTYSSALELRRRLEIRLFLTPEKYVV